MQSEQSSNDSPEPEVVKQELDDAIQGSKDVLATAMTASPFFPDTITLDRTKLTVTKRRFIATSDMMSTPIEDIGGVTTTLGPIFGSVNIVSRVMNSRPYTVRYLWRKDAIRMKRIAQGYIIARERGIDCSNLSTEELSKRLFELGIDTHSV